MLIISALSVPVLLISAAAGHHPMPLFETVFPWVGIILSLLCIAIVLVNH